jgi:hypothetical protein
MTLSAVPTAETDPVGTSSHDSRLSHYLQVVMGEMFPHVGYSLTVCQNDLICSPEQIAANQPPAEQISGSLSVLPDEPCPSQ